MLKKYIGIHKREVKQEGTVKYTFIHQVEYCKSFVAEYVRIRAEIHQGAGALTKIATPLDKDGSVSSEMSKPGVYASYASKFIGSVLYLARGT